MRSPHPPNVSPHLTCMLQCTWPENVPSRKKTTVKRESDETDRTLSPESASPSSSAPTTTRDGSPARKSPLNGLHGTEGRVSGRRTHRWALFHPNHPAYTHLPHLSSEPNTAAASPIVSPIDVPNGATSRRPRSVRKAHHSLIQTVPP